MTGPHPKVRRALRAECEIDARLAWGFEERQATVIEFSTAGLTFGPLDVPVGAAIVVELDLPRGKLALCARVVHRRGSRTGMELLPAGDEQREAMEAYLWDLLSCDLKHDSECVIAGCDKPRKARGLCSSHYSRWRRKSKK